VLNQNFSGPTLPGSTQNKDFVKIKEHSFDLCSIHSIIGEAYTCSNVSSELFSVIVTCCDITGLYPKHVRTTDRLNHRLWSTVNDYRL